MGFIDSKVLLIATILNFLVQNTVSMPHDMTEEEEKAHRCLNQKCMGDNDDELMKNGDYVCYQDPKHMEFGPSTSSRCAAECHGFDIAADQTQCLCKFCKQHKNLADMFCPEPDTRAIEFEECDAKVCTGKVPFRGMFCKPNHPHQ